MSEAVLPIPPKKVPKSHCLYGDSMEAEAPQNLIGEMLTVFFQTQPNVVIFHSAAEEQGDKRITLKELYELPADARKEYLRTAAESILEVYKTNPELTDFEAFGENDFYDNPPTA